MSQFFNSPGSGYNDSLVPGVRSDALEQRHFMSRVFGWMTVGLLITGIVALLVSENTKFVASLANGGYWIVFIAQFGLVIWFGAGINRMSAGLATILFLAYAAMTGLTFSILFLIYTQASIASTFFITAGTFGSMALYGYVTKRDLTGVGHYAGMAALGRNDCFDCQLVYAQHRLAGDYQCSRRAGVRRTDCLRRSKGQVYVSRRTRWFAGQSEGSRQRGI